MGPSQMGPVANGPVQNAVAGRRLRPLLESRMTLPILQNSLPHFPWLDPRLARLPGVVPLEGEDWLLADEAFAGQMARRDALIAERPDQVHALLPGAMPAATELYALVLERLARRDGYQLHGDKLTRPDGVSVPLNPAQPLKTLGRLVQEDFCLLEAAGGEHLLTGAILCFPASWTLSQKLGRPLTAIHDPVPTYDEAIARRVQRMFDAIRVEQPLWRMNYLSYDDPELFQPRLEGQRRPPPVQHVYLRSERQCLRRLPGSRAVVFSIHSYVMRVADLPPEARQTFLAAMTH